MKGSIPFVACMMLVGAGYAQEPRSLYIADEDAGAIYIRNSDDPSTRPLLLSGQLSVSAKQAAFADANRLVFVPSDQPQRVVLLDRSGRSLSEIREFPAGDVPVAMAGGPEGDIACLFMRGSTLVIAEFTRDEGGWQYSERTPPGMVHSLGASYELYKTQDDTYFIVQGLGELKVFLISFDSETITNQLSLPAGRQRVVMNAEDRRILISTNQGGEVSVFAADGSPIENEPAAQSQLWNQLSGTFDWASNPALSAFLPGVIFSDDAPFTGSPNPRYSGYTNGKIDPARDVSGASVLARNGADAWVFHDWINNGVSTVEAGAESLVREFHLERGTGPSLGNIRGITVGADSMLYALCDEFGEYRILKVDPLSGNRTVHVDLPPGLDFVEALGSNTDGSLAALSAQGLGFDRVYTRWRVTRDDDASTTVLTQDFSATAPSNYLTARLASDGSALLINQEGGVKTLRRLDSTGTAIEGRVPFAFGDFTIVSEDLATKTLEATATIPAGAQPETVELLVNDHELVLPENQGPLTSTVYTLPMTLVSPSGTMVQVDCEMKYVAEAGSNPRYRGRALFRFDGAGSEGTWTLRVVHHFNQGDPTMNRHVANAHAAPVRHAMMVEDRPDGRLLVRESYPFGMQLLDPATGVVENVTPILPDGQQQDLEFAGDLLLTASGDYFLSSLETTAILKVDSTGTATVYAEGRPEGVTPELLGLSPRSVLRLAEGPRVLPEDFRPTGWVFE